MDMTPCKVMVFPLRIGQQVTNYLTCSSEKTHMPGSSWKTWLFSKGPLCTHTPFQYCRSGKPPKLLPEYKIPDGCPKKSCKQREKLQSKKRETSCAGSNYFCSTNIQFWPFSGFLYRAWKKLRWMALLFTMLFNYIYYRIEDKTLCLHAVY